MGISIIIPTYNEEEYLPKLLESIKKQNYTDYEIIVADANSTDRTREIAEEYGCIIVDGGMPGVGRNRGAEVAKEEYLLFLDSDLTLTDDFLRAMLYEFKMEKLDIAIGQMEPLSKKKEVKIVHDFANNFMIASEKIKPHGAGCYGIITKKELHEKYGGFDESLSYGEDTDYIERIGKYEKFRVLRKAKVGVSTRRLEEKGLRTLAKQYGISTVRDYMGIRTDAEDLKYGFEHEKKKPEKKHILEEEIGLDHVKLKEYRDYIDNQIQEIKKSIESKPKREKKIVFYCICGEGMGHAIRSGVILNHLKDKYDLYIFTSNRAYTYLNEKFDNVYEIGCFNTVYEDNKVNNMKTFFKAIEENPQNLKDGYNEIYKKARKLKPNVLVTDFENYGSYVAKLLKIPLISLDNIHMISETKIDYPSEYYGEMLKAKAVIKTYVPKPKIHILTSFFYPKIRSSKNAILFPPVLREEIFKLEPKTEDYILVYQTSKESINLINKLKRLDEKFIVYGFNKNEIDENLIFKEFNDTVFFKDLANSKAVICNGGFTLISEAIYLKKPIFSIPAQGNFEQILNGFYVQKLGYGAFNKTMNINRLKAFLAKLPKYQAKLNKNKKTDNTCILREIEYRIEKYSK